MDDDFGYKKPPLSKEEAEPIIKKISTYEENTLYTYSPEPLFHTGQIYDRHAVFTIMCKTCKRKELFVGHHSHLTVIKCPHCGWETIIHDG